MKTFGRVICTLLAALTGLACFTSCSSTAMDIGGWEASYDMVRYFALNYMNGYEGLTPEDFKNDPELQESLEDNVIASLSMLASYKLLADKYGIELTDADKDEIEATIKELRDSYDSKEDYEAALEANFVTEDVLNEIYSIQYLCDDLYDYLTDEYTGLERFRSDTATIEADIDAGNWFAAEYICVPYSSQSQYESRKDFTEGLLTRIRNGESLTDMYNEYCTDYGVGITYYKLDAFTYTQEKEYFEDAVTSLEIGGVSEVLDTEDGFVIIKRLALDDTYIDENFISVFCAGYLEREFFGFIEEYSAQLVIEYKGKYEDLKFWEIE